MNTNINDIESRFTHDTVLYEDSELRALIEQLNSVHNLINSTIPSQVSALSQKESLWSGETNEKYLGLKDFIQQYQADFADAVGKLHEAADGLETLFYHIKDAKRIKEIDSV